MPLAPRALLLHNIEEYMRTYITSAEGGDGHNAHGGGGTVSNLLNTLGFGFGGRRTEVRLDAPLVHAYFSTKFGARNTQFFNFSRDVIRVQFGQDDGSGTGVPMYLIPYLGGHARGVKLPSQAQDGMNEVFAITAAQDGCTFEVFGSQASPYCSHSNCIDKASGERRDKMKQRIDKLHTRFLAAERAIAGGFAMPAGTRVQFEHYEDDRMAPPGGPIHQLNYTQGAKIAARSLPDQAVKGARAETGRSSHRRYWITLRDSSRQDVLDSPVGCGQVIGRRRNGVWQFYYQQSTTLYFNVLAVDKVGPKAVTGSEDKSGAHGKAADVILSSGGLWPTYSSHALDFSEYE